MKSMNIFKKRKIELKKLMKLYVLIDYFNFT